MFIAGDRGTGAGAEVRSLDARTGRPRPPGRLLEAPRTAWPMRRRCNRGPRCWRSWRPGARAKRVRSDRVVGGRCHLVGCVSVRWCRRGVVGSCFGSGVRPWWGRCSAEGVTSRWAAGEERSSPVTITRGAERVAFSRRGRRRRAAASSLRPGAGSPCTAATRTTRANPSPARSAPRPFRAGPPTGQRPLQLWNSGSVTGSRCSRARRLAAPASDFSENGPAVLADSRAPTTAAREDRSRTPL